MQRVHVWANDEFVPIHACRGVGAAHVDDKRRDYDGYDEQGETNTAETADAATFAALLRFVYQVRGVRRTCVDARHVARGMVTISIHDGLRIECRGD